MQAMETINSLLKSVEMVGDGSLKNEMRDKVFAVRDDLVATYERLRAQQREFDGLKLRLEGQASRVSDMGTHIYDPPA